MTKAMRGTVLALVGFAAAPVQAQESAMTSAALVYLSASTSVRLGEGSAALSREAAEAASVSLRQAGSLVVTAASAAGEVATIVLRDAATFVVFSLTMPLRLLDGRLPSVGTRVRVVPTEAGTLLDTEGRVLAFVVQPRRDHLLRSHAIR